MIEEIILERLFEQGILAIVLFVIVFRVEKVVMRVERKIDSLTNAITRLIDHRNI